MADGKDEGGNVRGENTTLLPPGVGALRDIYAI